jgi:hypothetical protein
VSYRASLLRTPETKTSTLKNGLRIATETVHYTTTLMTSTTYQPLPQAWPHSSPARPHDAACYHAHRLPFGRES